MSTTSVSSVGDVWLPMRGMRCVLLSLFAGAAASMRMCHGIEAVPAKKRLREDDMSAPTLSQLPASQPLFTPASSPMSSHQMHSQQMVFKRPADVLATQVDDESTDDEGVTV